jgi:DNA-binding PadR family transcriptional regulator
MNCFRRRTQRRRDLILRTLSDGVAASGQSLRDLLKQNGLGLSGPSFYMLMARMEEEGLVTGFDRQIQIDGQWCFPRWYIIE